MLFFVHRCSHPRVVSGIEEAPSSPEWAGREKQNSSQSFPSVFLSLSLDIGAFRRDSFHTSSCASVISKLLHLYSLERSLPSPPFNLLLRRPQFPQQHHLRKLRQSHLYTPNKILEKPVVEIDEVQQSSRRGDYGVDESGGVRSEGGGEVVEKGGERTEEGVT